MKNVYFFFPKQEKNNSLSRFIGEHIQIGRKSLEISTKSHTRISKKRICSEPRAEMSAQYVLRRKRRKPFFDGRCHISAEVALFVGAQNQARKHTNTECVLQQRYFDIFVWQSGHNPSMCFIQPAANVSNYFRIALIASNAPSSGLRCFVMRSCGVVQKILWSTSYRHYYGFSLAILIYISNYILLDFQAYLYI